MGKSQLSGSINGSNMPWIFQCDLRIEKFFRLDLSNKKSKKEESAGAKPTKKPGYLSVYIDIQNLFNFKNIVYVYDYTGSPTDDGCLTATEYQQQIQSQISVPAYINYYEMLMKNPYNYSLPIRASLGLQFSF